MIAVGWPGYQLTESDQYDKLSHENKLELRARFKSELEEAIERDHPDFDRVFCSIELLLGTYRVTDAPCRNRPIGRS